MARLRIQILEGIPILGLYQLFAPWLGTRCRYIDGCCG
jgi:hypothetical protein